MHFPIDERFEFVKLEVPSTWLSLESGGKWLGGKFYRAPGKSPSSKLGVLDKGGSAPGTKPLDDGGGKYSAKEKAAIMKREEEMKAKEMGAKSKSKTKLTGDALLATIPDSVKEYANREIVSRVEDFNESVKRTRALDKRFGGEGRYVSDAIKNRQRDYASILDGTYKDKFLNAAKSEGVDGNDVLKAMGLKEPIKLTADELEWLNQ
jgi:hypothetical protein